MTEHIADMVLDIETVAEPTSAVVLEMVKQIKPPANYKDEAKIEAHREKKKQEIISKAALRASTGRIVAVQIGLRTDAEWDFAVFVDKIGDEGALLKNVCDSLNECGCPIARLGTFNGKHFDVPFLTARSMHHGLNLHLGLPQEYGRHIDLRDVLGKQGSLDEWCQAILGEGKNGSGGDVAELVAAGAWDELHEYGMQDIKLTAALFDRYLGR